MRYNSIIKSSCLHFPSKQVSSQDSSYIFEGTIFQFFKISLRATFYEKDQWRYNIYVLVIVSYDVIAGARIHKQSTRISNIVGLIDNLKLMRALEVIDDETHDNEHGIFTRCAIECEGLEGTAESPVGSINFASLFATGENYVIHKVKGGVKYLGDILSGGVGMNDIHTISICIIGKQHFRCLVEERIKSGHGWSAW